MESQCQLFRKHLGCTYMLYCEGQQLQLLEGESGEEAPSKKNQKEQKEEHGRLLSRLQWGGPVGIRDDHGIPKCSRCPSVFF